MPGRKTSNHKHEYVPYSLIKHIERKMKEIEKVNPTRTEAMERLARELDEMIIKKKRFKR